MNAVLDVEEQTAAIVAALAGVGGHTDVVGDWWRAETANDADDSALSRSCVDASGRLIVSLSAPGPERRFACYRRREATTLPGTTAWDRLAWDGRITTGWRTWHARENASSWAHVARAVDIDNNPNVQAWHAALGAGARVYSVAANAGEMPWIAWQLDPRVRVEAALDAIGCAPAWFAVEPILGELLGGRVPRAAGPWSLAMRSDGSRWRIGTSRWARVADDDGKRRRFAATFASIGGCRSFAEGVYKVVAAAGAADLPIARAVELEFAAGDSAHIADAEFFLTVVPRDRTSGSSR